VSLKNNGTVEKYLVRDPHLLETLSFNSPVLNPVLNLLNAGVGLVRFTSLKNPTFWMKQLPAEMAAAMLMSGVKHGGGIRGAANMVKNITTSMLGTNNAAKQLERQGLIVGPHDYVDKMHSSYEGFEQQKHPLNPTRLPVIGKALGKIGEVSEKLGSSVDEGIRAHIYESALKDGKDLGLTGQDLTDYATHKARTFVNFSAKGASEYANTYRKAWVFAGAGLNGLDALIKGATGYGLNRKEAIEARKLFWTRAATMGAAATAWNLYQMSTNPNYAKIDENDQDSGLIFDIKPITGYDGFFKIPLPWDAGFVVNQLPTLVTRGLLGALGDKDGIPPEEMWRRIRKGVMDNVLPPMPIGFDENMKPLINAPTALAPIVETIMGYNPRQGGPLESGQSQRLSPEMRGRDVTPIGQWLSNTATEIGVPMSPVMADHLLRGYLSEYYGMANSVINMAMGPAENAPISALEGVMPTNPVKQYPFLRNFVTNPNKISHINEAYEATAAAEQEHGTVTKLFSSGAESRFNEYIQRPESRAYEEFASEYRKYRQELSENNQALDVIRNAKMPLKEKADNQKLLMENLEHISEGVRELEKQRIAREKAIREGE
jgi:hypothetical protein